MKTFIRRAASVLATIGLVAGVSSMTAPAQATDDDTSWGRIAVEKPLG